jgi:hypothetical protein
VAANSVGERASQPTQKAEKSAKVHNCRNLKSVTIGTSVTSIGAYAFFGSGLTSVTIPDSANASVGEWAFSSCTSLTNATLGNGVTTIGNWAFCNCTNVTSVTIGTNLTVIGNDAFGFCTSLKSVTIALGVTSIGDAAFGGCRRLTSVTIPNSVRSIGDSAFNSCNSLTNVTIGSGVTNIGRYALYGLPSLTGVYFEGNAPSADSTLFDPANNATVYYRQGTKGWNPEVQASGASFGVRTNRFGFTITGTSGLAIVVEACTNLANPIWSPVGTNTFSSGSSYFSDLQWTNYPARFYRLQSWSFGGRPMVLWNPRFQVSDISFGVRTNGFGFNITGTTNIPIVLEACTDLASPAWVSLRSGLLTNGSLHFSDPQWTNYPGRFYRLRWP